MPTRKSRLNRKSKEDGSSKESNDTKTSISCPNVDQSDNVSVSITDILTRIDMNMTALNNQQTHIRRLLLHIATNQPLNSKVVCGDSSSESYSGAYSTEAKDIQSKETCAHSASPHIIENVHSSPSKECSSEKEQTESSELCEDNIHKSPTSSDEAQDNNETSMTIPHVDGDGDPKISPSDTTKKVSGKAKAKGRPKAKSKTDITPTQN